MAGDGDQRLGRLGRCKARRAEKFADLLLLCRDETKHEDVAFAAVVALEDCFAQWRVAMESYLLAFRPVQVWASKRRTEADIVRTGASGRQ
jgi:hypothetical protein